MLQLFPAATMVIAALTLALRGNNPALCVFVLTYAALLAILFQPARRSKIIHVLAISNAFIFGLVVIHGIFVA